VKGALQLETHAPLWQKGAAPVHALPHAPQLFGSFPSSLHDGPHAWVAGGHAHLPEMQDCPLGHAAPHVPQLDESFVGSTHVEEHCVRPTAHGAWQVPFEHARPGSQACAQEPQFFASFARSKH
jgi:hypothetical protein